MIVSFIKKYFHLFLDNWEKAIIWFWDQFINTAFLKNHIISIASFIALYFFKEEFYSSYLTDWKFSLSSVNFIYYSLLYFFTIMVLYSWYLIHYVYYIKDKENSLKKNWYIKFLEDEYKVTYEPYVKWLWYFVTLLISWTAIYITVISMQSSLDVANSTLNWELDLKNTFEMFRVLWTWLGIAISIFIICFLYYRFSVTSKNSYVKEKYYNTYLKKSNK